MFKRSWVRIPALDGDFFALTCKNFTVCLKSPKINKKEAKDGPLKTACSYQGASLNKN